jgi:hypothetical protein
VRPFDELGKQGACFFGTVGLLGHA